jgi:AGZA family xanthine/uracil permease-like MFS transporter
VFGYFGYLYAIIPKATVFPILVFVGLEITAQSFHATPRRHFPAVALACVPALAALALIYVDKLVGALVPAGQIPVLPDSLRLEVDTVRMLANGFVLTSLLWGSWLAALIDRRLPLAASYCGIAGAFALFGVIHSPLAGSPLFLPWRLSDDQWRAPAMYAAGYWIVAGLLLVWSRLVPTPPLSDDEHAS